MEKVMESHGILKDEKSKNFVEGHAGSGILPHLSSVLL